MSIINDMLKDLDTQRVHRNTANDAVLQGLGLSGNITTATQKALAVVIACSLLLMLAIFSWPYAMDLLADNTRQNIITADNSAPESSPNTPDGTQHQRGAPSQPPPATARRPTITAHNAQTSDLQHHETPGSIAQSPASNARSTPVITRQFSAQERAQRAHQQAVHALREGQYKSAKILLVETLELDNSRHESRLLLANLHIRQQNSIDAESVLANGLGKYPGHAAYARLYAQLLIEQLRYSEALHYLQAALPGATRDAGYHALLAGVYQRTGQATDAAKHYQLALQLVPTRGEWWMGLGISLEQSGSSVNAYAAYMRALQYPLSPTLAQYINTRIRTLPRQQGRD